ncbi:hypothetical protein, partial [Nocardia cyriacigeorgica]|uniref:hypothetical protein n=1 Tax=Nocardia cyriacigeorgica TaxID=135487 RepID=UPI002455A645
AMAMGHVVFKEFFVEKSTPRFLDYIKRFTDLPYLITLDERDGVFVPGKFPGLADEVQRFRRREHADEFAREPVGVGGRRRGDYGLAPRVRPNPPETSLGQTPPPRGGAFVVSRVKINPENYFAAQVMETGRRNILRGDRRCYRWPAASRAAM